MIQFIEIKNCLGHESENVWRTSIDNRRLESAPRDLDAESRNSLDIEVTQKVASTITCFYGAWTESQHTESGFELSVLWEKLISNQIPKDKKQLLVILFLEGNFGENGPKGRTKTMVMKRIQESIKKKLAWLNCRVIVVDSNTYSKSLFKVEKL